MPEDDDVESRSPQTSAQSHSNKTRLSPSPQLAFPSMNPGRGASPQPSASSSGRHSHSRSKSVNLSPTISAAGGSTFPSGAMRWDGGHSPDPSLHPASAINLPSSTSSHHLSHLGSSSSSSSASAVRAVSPLLRPSSPLYVNVPGLGSAENWRGHSNYSTSSESGSSEGSSPEIRRGSHFARSMERSASSGSLSSAGNSHLAPLSPRASLRRTSSPSRAYAVPISPRLQAFGGNSHSRKLSGGSSQHLALGEPLVRSTSPLTSSNGLNIDTSPRLPIDSVWPGNSDSSHTASPHGTEAIPIGANKSQSTPIPPSLRDDLSPNNMNGGFTAIPYSGPSSPTTSRRLLSSSPQDPYFIHRDQRTPSPSGWATKREKRSPSSPAMLSHSPSTRQLHHSSSAGSLPNLAAPKAISKRSLNLEAAAYALPLHHQSPSFRIRSLSNSSTGSEADVNEGFGLSTAAIDENPTRKALSPPRDAQAKLDAQHAVAEVTLGASGMDDSNEEQSKLISINRRGSLEREGNANLIDTEDSSSHSPSSLSSLETTKAIASAHGIPHGNHISAQDYQSYRFNNPGRGAASLPTLNGNVHFGSDSHLFRSRSPAMETVLLGESPPKTRSFIGMPPRSGYDLSDDPDDVGSEDGSTGSGRESIDTNEDRGDDDDDEEGGDDDDDDQKMQGEEKSEEEEGDRGGYSQDEQRTLRRTKVPQRPGLTQANIVAPVPMTKSVDYEGGGGGGESMQWNGEQQQSAVQHRTDLGLTRNDGDDEEDEDEANGDEGSEVVGESQEDKLVEEGQEGSYDEGEAAPEESFSTLERIFLFAKSEMAYHRVLVSHSLPDWILEVELSDAVEFVIPLLNGLACDENDICTAFAPHIHRVMWHFFRNCPLAEDQSFGKQIQEGEQQDADVEGQKQEENGTEEKATRPKLSVSVFTPLLCALLLNADATIAGATQTSLVYFFARLQGFSFLDVDQVEDENLPEEERQKEQQQQFSSGRAQNKEAFDMDTGLIRDAAAREEKRIALEEYDFGEEPKRMIRDELLHQVALAIGNLNIEQTLQIREMGANESHGEGSREDSGDAVMDDVPLAAETSNDESQPSSQHDDFEDIESQVKDEPIEFEDTEMSLDMMEEGQESGDVALNATTASLDNVSMTMSDVEEEVAVGRMASISLLAALGAENLVTREFLVKQIVPEMIKFAADQTFFVRKEVAVSMGALAKSIGNDAIQENDFLNIFESFCNDRIWHVRQAACLSLPNLFAQIDDRKMKRKKVVEIMRLFVGDVSRNVRVAALDIIGELIYLFHEDIDGVPQELVRHFLGDSFDLAEGAAAAAASEVQEEGGEGDDKQMDVSTLASHNSSNSNGYDAVSEASQDGLADFGFGWSGMHRSNSTTNANGLSGWSSDGFSAPSYRSTYNNFHLDPDRPLVMAYNFPAVILTLGKSHWSKLKAVHFQLCSNPSSKVRRSLAASLHEIAKIIGVEWTTNDLFEVFQRFLDSRFEMDEEVKMAMLQNIDIFLDQVSLAKGLESLKFLLNLWNEKANIGDSSRFSSNWRLREKLISLIPNLAKRYLLEDDEGVLVVLMQSAIVDNVSSVRLQGIKVVTSLYHIFEEHDQVLADGFLGMLVDVGENESYRGRVACLQCLSELCKNRLQRSSVEMLVMKRLIELSKDPVVDVRIAVAQLVSQICSLDELYALPKSRSEEFVDLIRRLSHDEATLVREVILSYLPSDDPGRQEPTEGAPTREQRQLVLGPADGSLHRPAASQSSFDMNGDAIKEVQSFEMEEEEEDDSQRDGMAASTSSSSSSSQVRNPFASKDGSPSMENSTLMKRRFMNRGYSQPQSNSRADSSMFEDADDDEDEDDHESQGQHLRGTGFGTSQVGEDEEDDEEEMITIPSPDNFLMLSTEAVHRGISSDSDLFDDEDEEESPHHLLGIAQSNDSPLRQTVKRTLDGDSPEQDRRFSPHGLSLESPERPWNLKGNNDGDHVDSATITQALEDHVGKALSPTSPFSSQQSRPDKKPLDPFLAFVADKRNDQTANDDKVAAVAAATVSNHILSSPAGGNRQELNDADDDEHQQQ